MGLFIPGLQGQGPSGVRFRFSILSAFQVMPGQPMQQRACLLAQRLALLGGPLLKGGAVGEGEALQQVTPVKLDRRPQALKSIRVEWPGHRCRDDGGQVEGMVALAVELQRLAGDEQVGRSRVGIPDAGAQVGQREAQAAPGIGLGPVGPEEGGQGVAGVRAVALDGEVGQQRTDLVGLEGRDELPVQGGLEGAEEGDGEVGHGSRSRRGPAETRRQSHYTATPISLQGVTPSPRSRHAPAAWRHVLMTVC